MAVSAESTSSADAAPQGGADELLSQMAGDEISRLLSEAEVSADEKKSSIDPADVAASGPAVEPHRTTVAAALDTVPPNPSDATAAGEAVVLASELDKVFERQTAEPGGAMPATEAADSSHRVDVPPGANGPDDVGDGPMDVDGVSDLLGRLSAGERSGPPAPADPQPVRPLSSAGSVADPGAVVAASLAAGSGDGPGSVGDTPVRVRAAEQLPGQAGTSSAPLQHLAAMGNAEAAAVRAAANAAEDHRQQAEQARRERSWQIQSRLLGWIALPLDPFPEAVRDVMGKVAIVTLLNAVAVLLYLTFFRR